MSYVAMWYDGVGRPTATAKYGTNGDGSPPTRPDSAPESSDTVLVTTTLYNATGEADATIDPAGREDRQEFDDAGRVVKTVQNYVSGSSSSSGAPSDENVTVETTYNADGQVLTFTVDGGASAMRRITQRDEGRDGLSRREMLGIGAATSAALCTRSAMAGPPPTKSRPSALAAAIAKLGYLTAAEEFREFNREKPRIDQLPGDRLREIGLDRQTWRLEVVPDPESDSKVENPLSQERGTALDFPALVKLAEKHAVRFLMVLTCTNMAQPLGMGLWEGVPLREVVWLARPKGNVRRVYYYGYHNDVPEQRFISSLSVGRVLEDPPGELPIILCYKLNGQWLPVRNGGPVRLIVPGAYGNKSVKWLQRVVLTNSYQANDKYAEWNNDVESWMKTQARFIDPPRQARAGQPLPLVGLAQVGISGLQGVQYSILPEGAPPAAGPCLTKADWKDAEILPPPEDWGGGLEGGKLPPVPLQFDPQSGRPRAWPLRYTIAHWAALAPGLEPGRYRLRCRTIDDRGCAQPMPRPFRKSGNNTIQEVPLVVEE